MLAAMHANDVLVDVGANIGLWSYLFAASGHDVFAFEPFESNLALQNITRCLNPTISSRVRTFPVGLSYENGWCELWQDPHVNRGDTVAACGDATTLPLEREKWKRHFRGGGRLLGSATMRVLDQIAPPELFHRGKVMKIDTEGMELKALRGATRFLTEGKPPRRILAELAFFSGAARAELLDFLARHGYRPITPNAATNAGDAVFVHEREEKRSGGGRRR